MSSRALPPQCADALVRAASRLAELSDDELRRAGRVRALMEVGWLTVHLSLLVPERFAPKQFATPDFQVKEHIDRHVGLFRERLATVDQTLDRMLAE